jgi:hypothetical protein
MGTLPEFTPFPKIARWSKEVVVTEKVDGTNAQIFITDDGAEIYAGSRTRWITPESDNFGFARWVSQNRDELLRLGPGSHFGEWYGQGIQRNYGLKEKRFALFNVSRWGNPDTRPACCGTVPELWRGSMNDLNVHTLMTALIENGSMMVPGFMKPEGIVVFHTASGTLLKKLIEGDDIPKGQAAE